MELITSKYIKMSKFDLFTQIVAAQDEKKYKKLKFFRKLVNSVMEYEREKKRTVIDYIYVSVDCLKDFGILDVSNLPISRQSVLNAILFATFAGDIEMVQKLSAFMNKTQNDPLELGDILSYVLKHSMDINEYMSIEQERYIYNVDSNKIEKGKIYSLDEEIKVKRLK